MKAASIDKTRALSVFNDGNPHGPKDVAIACQVHTRIAVWIIRYLDEAGEIRLVRENRANHQFGQFVRAK